ncbi:hypothetical protein [Streptomyces sp. NPDC001070]
MREESKSSPSSGDPRIRALPPTIGAIDDALPAARRDDFRAAVTAARQGEELNEVMTVWWMEAMFEAVPGRDQRLDDTVAGIGLVELEPEVTE